MLDKRLAPAAVLPPFLLGEGVGQREVPVERTVCVIGVVGSPAHAAADVSDAAPGPAGGGVNVFRAYPEAAGRFGAVDAVGDGDGPLDGAVFAGLC